MESPDKTDLVRRLIADDPSALEDAYQLHSARCNGIAYRVLHDDEAARDAVQEAFLALWRHRHGLVVRTAGLAPWLSVVTRNAAIGMLRRDVWRAAREVRTQSHELTRTAPDPAEAVTSRVDAQRLRSALHELPSEQQTVVELAYFQFMTMAQIAERTETPLGTVKRRSQMALRQLGRLMREQKS